VLAGRFQVLRGRPEWVLDVAHNPAAAACLATSLAARPIAGRTHVVLGMLGDKDVEGFARALAPQSGRWYAADLGGEARGLDDRALAARLSGIADAAPAGAVASACARAQAGAAPGDRVLVCGSFHTVGAALRLRGLC
jgi:dihydrofolate synthase/folylpolyglutamate synthase